MRHLRSALDQALIRTARHLARQAGARHEQSQAMLSAYDEGVVRGLDGGAYLAEDPVVGRDGALPEDYAAAIERGEAAPPGSPATAG
jgi:hypothetical protein